MVNSKSAQTNRRIPAILQDSCCPEQGASVGTGTPHYSISSRGLARDGELTIEMFEEVLELSKILGFIKSS